MTCPKCGGTMRFVLSDDAMKCADCGHLEVYTRDTYFEEEAEDYDYYA